MEPLDLTDAAARGAVRRLDLTPGLYELVYAFRAPDFDADGLYFPVAGRRTGPWDYVPWGFPHSGDCLLPCARLRTTVGGEVVARAFIPRREELDRRWFNGRVGFRVREAGPVDVALSASVRAEWESVLLTRVDGFVDESLDETRLRAPDRLFLDDAGVAALRAHWGRSPASVRLDEALDDLAGFAPPASFAEANTISTKLFAGARHVYEDDIVIWGRYLTALALRARVLGRAEDFDQLVRWTDALAAVPVWGDSADPHGRDYNNDLMADFHMMGLVLAVNWHGDRFGPERLAVLHRKIAHQADAMLAWIVSARSSWPGTSTQNHAYFGFQTLVLAGAVLLRAPEYRARAVDWLRIATSAFRRFLSFLPSDGSFHEGLGYADFGLCGLAPPLLALEQVTGDAWMPETWFKAHYRVLNRLTVPVKGFGFSWDDGTNYFPSHYPVAVRNAARAADPEVRAAAGEWLERYFATGREASPTRGRRSFGIDAWCLIYAPGTVDPSVPATVPGSTAAPAVEPEPFLMPAAGYFMGPMAPARRAYFFTAPPHGHEMFRRDRHTYGYGHHHPDTGNVVLFDAGRWVLSDTGYTVWKSTSEHNALLVDGHGQYNDHYVWMPPPPWDIDPDVARMTADGRAASAEADFAYIYPKPLGVRHWRRAVHVAPEGLVVDDRVELAAPRALTLSWISEAAWTPATDGRSAANATGWTLTLHGDPTALRAETITPVNSSLVKGLIQTPPTWEALRVESPAPTAAWRVVSLFRPAGGGPGAADPLDRWPWLPFGNLVPKKEAAAT